MAKTATATIKQSIDQISEQLPALRDRCADLRKQIAALKKRPLLKNEILSMARGEADRRQARAIESQSFHFNRNSLDGKIEFFRFSGMREVAADELQEMFVAGGGLHRLIDEMEKRPERPGAMSSSDKTAAIEKLQRELDQLETEAEDARMALAELGINYPPDPEIQAHVFLEWREVDRSYNKSKVAALRQSLERLHSIGAKIIDDGNQIAMSAGRAAQHLHSIKNTQHTTEDLKRQERIIGEISAEAAANAEKLAANSEVAAKVNKVINRCREFLTAKNMSVALLR